MKRNPLGSPSVSLPRRFKLRQAILHGLGEEIVQFRANIEQLPEVNDLKNQKLTFRDGGNSGGAFRFRQQGDLPEKIADA